jgi:UDP-N-acetylmuramyl pentapeptide synthase
MALSLEKTLPKEIIVLLKGSRIMKMERFLDIL